MIDRGNRSNGIPYIISDGKTKRLERLDLNKKKLLETQLQTTLESCSDIIPFVDITNSISNFIHLCREYKTKSGYIDNIFLGEHGEIAIIEAKLWRNPDARRRIIGQIFDYASSLTGISFDNFQTGVQATLETNDSLFDMYNNSFDGLILDESHFTDAIMRTLNRGEFILVVVGDGITEEAEEIGGYLNRNYQFNRSKLGLVELQVFEIEAGKLLFFPWLITRTIDVEKSTITIENRDGNLIAVTERMTNNNTKKLKKDILTREALISSIEEEFGSKSAENANRFIEICLDSGMIVHKTAYDYSLGFEFKNSREQKFVPFFFLYQRSVWYRDRIYFNITTENVSDFFSVQNTDTEFFKQEVSNITKIRWKTLTTCLSTSLPLLDNSLSNPQNIMKIVNVALEFKRRVESRI